MSKDLMRYDVIVEDALRGVVLQDWTDAVMAEQRSAAVNALARKYTIVEEPGTP